MSDFRTDEAFRMSICTHVPAGGEQRWESDRLGQLSVPLDAYWGINVARALQNFSISGRPIADYSDFIFAYASVKQAAARANAEVGLLEPSKAQLIERACEDIRSGALRDQFIVDVIQGGAGASTNMNFNEVIANRALELAGRPKGDYARMDPNDDVNLSQSANDTYPTALKIGLLIATDRLLEELMSLSRALHCKARELAGVVKVGRTQLQDAAPMTLGQEFEGFALTLEEDRAALEGLRPHLCEINLGATAIGTGIAADPRFKEAVRRCLSDIVGYPLRNAINLIEAASDVGAYVKLSAALKHTAIKLSKICNDLRLLSSGPEAGWGEIVLPARQGASSIMPGKTYPVVPEVVNEVAFLVAGGDVAVTMAAEAGQLQLNAFVPVIAHVLFENLKWSTAGMRTLREHCIGGITANRRRLVEQTRSFVGVVTALIPCIGYDPATRIARQALEQNADIAELVVASRLLTREQVEHLLAAERLSDAIREDLRRSEGRAVGVNALSLLEAQEPPCTGK